MKDYNTEMVDLDLSDAMASYQHMDHDELYETIVNEWPEQIAMLLVEFFFKTTCSTCDAKLELLHVERSDNAGTFIMGFCDCDMQPISEDEL